MGCFAASIHDKLGNTTNRETMIDQFDRLESVDWDALLVLDATRWDYWQEMVGDGEPVRSPASCTPEWIKAFNRRFDLSDTVCVTANPEVTRHSAEFLYSHRDDLWKRAWEHVNGLGTVPQERVTEAVMASLVAGPDRPVYSHYPGCHGPYPMHEPPIPVMRNNPEADEVRVDIDYLPDEIIMDPNEMLADEDSWLTVEMLRDAYCSNLEWAWEAIQPLLDSDRTVVVTADHGELLGERIEIERQDGETVTYESFYGHPCPLDVPELREVPFAVYD